MIETTIAQLLPCSPALAKLGDADGLSLSLTVRVSRLQIAANEWLEPHAERWNRLVEECGDGRQVRQKLEDGSENPHWDTWLETSRAMKAETVQLDAEPLTLADLEGLDPAPKSSVLTPLMRAGLLVDGAS